MKFAGANGRRRVVGFLAAIVVSQGVFALSHLPQRIHSGVPAADMPAGVLVLFMWGVLFSLVFVSGGSLLYSVGAHMLINAPLPLIESAESAPLIVGATIVVWLVTVCLWRWLQRRERRRQAQRQPDMMREARPV